MVINFAQGKIVVSMHEIQILLSATGVSLYAMAEDIKLMRSALTLVADAGAVRWSIKLDSIEQFDDVASELGIDG